MAGLHDDLLPQGTSHVDVDTDAVVASDRDRRPSIQGDEREKGPAPCTENLRSIAATVALALSQSLHIGYAFGHGPACAGQIFQSVLEGQRNLLRLFCLTCVFLGAAVGAACGGLLGDRIGRRWALIMSSVAPIAGWAMWSEARAPMHLTLGMLISGRLLVGLGSGMASVLVPVLIAELVPARMRGALVCLHQLAIGSGFTVAYGVGWNSVDAVTAADARTCIACGWRLAGLVGIVPALLGIVSALVIPESPRWLIRHGAACKGLADASLRAMRGPNQQRLVVAELAALERSAVIMTAPSYSWRRASLRTRFVLAAAVVVSTQVGGGFDSFVTPMETAKLKPGLQSLGLGHLSPRTLTVLVAAFAMVMLFLGALICEVPGIGEYDTHQNVISQLAVITEYQYTISDHSVSVTAILPRRDSDNAIATTYDHLNLVVSYLCNSLNDGLAVGQVGGGCSSSQVSSRRPRQRCWGLPPLWVPHVVSGRSLYL